MLTAHPGAVVLSERIWGSLVRKRERTALPAFRARATYENLASNKTISLQLLQPTNLGTLGTHPPYEELLRKYLDTAGAPKEAQVIVRHKPHVDSRDVLKPGLRHPL